MSAVDLEGGKLEMSSSFFHGCCDDGPRLDFTKATFPNPLWYVYWDWDFTITALWIIAYPIYWIFVSQMEFRRGCLRRWCGGRYIACGLFAMTMLPISLYRDCRFLATVRRQLTWWPLRQNAVLWCGHVFVVLGLCLVISSFHLLGLWASLLGDFFRIHEYKDDVRYRFPYSWFTHPMYWGSTFVFFGISLVMASQAGLLLSLFAMIMYQIAIYFEHRAFCFYHHGVAFKSVEQQTDGVMDDENDENNEEADEEVQATEDKDTTSETDMRIKDTANPNIQNLGAGQGEIDEHEGAAQNSSPSGDEQVEGEGKVKDQGDVQPTNSEGKKDR